MRHIHPDSMKISQAEAIRDQLHKREFSKEKDNICQHNYRPFDTRWLYWERETKLLDRSRPDYFPHVMPINLWIVSQQKPRREWSKPQFIKYSGSLDLMDRGASCIPLFLKREKEKLDLFSNDDRRISEDLSLNLSDKAVEYLKTIGTIKDAESLFYHVLSVLHSPNYATENDGALRQDWARVPLPDNRDNLITSANLGRQIAALLDPETPVSGVTSGKLRPELKTIAVVSRVGAGNLDPNTDFSLTVGWGHEGKNKVMPGKGKVGDRPYTSDEQTAIKPVIDQLGSVTHDIYLNDVAYWCNIPDRVWNYTIGGYQVIKKWLSYREEKVLGRSLKPEEVPEVTNMARRIAAILLLKPELNVNYEAVKSSTYNWSNPS